MQNLPSLEVKGFRVLTTKQIAEAYDTTITHIKQNFRTNKSRYIEGKHYIELKGEALKQFKNRVEKIYLVGKTANTLYLWTEKGALLHAKSLNTDKAWEVYDYLVDFYFRAKEEVLLPVEQKALTVPAPTLPSARPVLSNPIQVLHALLDLTRVYGMTVTSFGFTSMRSALYDKCIGIRSDFNVADTAHELAFELAHAIVHKGYGDMVKSPLAKDYNQHAERIAELLLRALDTKIKLAL